MEVDGSGMLWQEVPFLDLLSRFPPPPPPDPRTAMRLLLELTIHECFGRRHGDVPFHSAELACWKASEAASAGPPNAERTSLGVCSSYAERPHRSYYIRGFPTTQPSFPP